MTGKRDRYEKKYPDETVAMIKAIFNLDQQERQAAGFKLGTFNLARRIADAYEVSFHLVVKIKEGKKRRKVHASPIFQHHQYADPERLEAIRKRRMAQGAISASYRPPKLMASGRRLTYLSRIGGRRTRS